ncbi:MAG TPA: phosphoglycerate kinase, partial [Patescibacteria group bacterium]|nr:phosphoglycerate kinase [Patescibacteria group bacterium]
MKLLQEANFKGKKVFLRVDLNVPMKDGVIEDDNRIVAVLPTIKYILDHGGK